MKNERIAYAFLTVLAAAILINLFRDEADMLPFERKRYWIVKSHSEKTYPVVFAGDSRIFRGISPEHFRETFPGADGVNLGYSALGYHPRYMDFVHERLDTTAERPLVVIGISAHPFTPEGFEAANFLWEKNGKKKEEIIQYMYFYNFNKLVAPFDILDLMSGNRRRKAEMNDQVTYHFNGWMESYQLNPDTTFYNKRYRNAFINNQWDSVQTEGFLRTIREWTSQGIGVVGFRTPASYTLQHLEDSLSGFSVEAFKKRFLDCGAKWVEVDPGRYRTYDGNHLEHESAVRFSRDLGRAIRKLYRYDSL